MTKRSRTWLLFVRTWNLSLKKLRDGICPSKSCRTESLETDTEAGNVLSYCALVSNLKQIFIFNAFNFYVKKPVSHCTIFMICIHQCIFDSTINCMQAHVSCWCPSFIYCYWWRQRICCQREICDNCLVYLVVSWLCA